MKDKKTRTFPPLSKDDRESLIGDSQEIRKTGRRTAAISGLSSSSLSKISTINEKYQQLREEFEDYRSNSNLVKLIDPKKVEITEFAKRTHDEIVNAPDWPDFLETMKDGQGVTALVRPHPSKPDFYQVVYGQRRWTACLELGIPYRAEIRDVDDVELSFLMSKENGMKQGIAPYTLYKTWDGWLHRGFVKSKKEIIVKSGYAKSLVYAVQQMDAIPDEIIDRIEERVTLSHRDWAKLVGLFSLKTRAEISDLISELEGAKQISYSYVLGLVGGKPKKPASRKIKYDNCDISIKEKTMTVKFEDSSKIEEFLELVKDF